MSNVIGFSKGLYSSWFYHAPTRSLFDCGEGCASYLGRKVAAVQNIFISHGHNDHIAGLLTFIGIRESGMVAMETNEDGEEVVKSLNIYYPENCPEIKRIRRYIELTWERGLSFELRWIGLHPNQYVRISDTVNVVPFETKHYYHTSLGYAVKETRKRLKPEFTNCNIPALLKSGQINRNELIHKYDANTFVYTLDSNNLIDGIHIENADSWIADTTFLRESDRGKNVHGTVGEMVELAVAAGVSKLYCAHFSPRYNKQEILNVIGSYINQYSEKLLIVPIYYSGVQTF